MQIGLDDSETELDPQNPILRGARTGGSDKNPLDEIIKAFNERYFADWKAPRKSRG